MDSSSVQLVQAVRRFKTERAVSLCATTIDTDYSQLESWMARCPHQSLLEIRQALIWTLGQEPNKSAQRVAMYLRCFCKWACSEDVRLLTHNPIASFKMPKRPQAYVETIVIPNTELPLVIAALERRNKALPQWDLYAQFMVQTGMRTGEVRALTTKDLNGNRILVAKNFTQRHGLKMSTKTNRARWVPLNAVAMEILERLTPDDGGYFFPWIRTTFAGFFRNRMASLHQQGVIRRRYRPYDLRHTALSRWLEAGIPVTEVANWAGNTPEVVFKHYANTTSEYQMPIL